MSSMFRRLRNRVRYRRFDRDLQDELAFHREMKRRELEGAPEASVSRVMGNERLMRERARDVWVPPAVDALRQDLRDAWRVVWRRPLLTVASVAALVSGMGAATLAYALADALLFRSLPVNQPEELVSLEAPSFSYPILQEVTARSPFLHGTFGWTLESFDIMWGEESTRSLVWLASGPAFNTLGVRPALGRLFDARDDWPGAPAVGVLTDRAWRTRYGGDPAIVGRAVRVHGVPVTIVGVAPPGFFGVAPGRSPDLMLPLTLAPQLSPQDGDVLGQRARAWLHVMARRQRGLSLEAANARFSVVWPQVLEATVDPSDPPDRRAYFRSRESGLEDGRAGFSSVRNQYGRPLAILSLLSGLLWLVGCATVANLLVIGTWGRSRELAVRLALGCERRRLARQLWCEGLVVSTTAALLTLAVSPLLGAGVVALLTTEADPIVLELAVDWRLGAFASLLIVFSTALISIVPMLIVARGDAGSALKSGSRAVSVHGRAGGVLAATQTAFCVVLLVSAGLLLRSLIHLLSIDPGVDTQQLLVAEVDPSRPGAGAATEPAELRLEQVHDRLTHIAGLHAVAYAMYPPLSHEDGSWTSSIGVDGAPPADARTTFFNAVSPGFFATVGTPLLAGRDFRLTDDAGAPGVVIINETLAARVFPDRSPLGRLITIGRRPERRNLTIVGVVGDATYQRLQEARPAVAYLPHRQSADARTGRAVYFVIRTVGAPARSITDVREALKELSVPARVEPLSHRVQASLVTERVLAVLGVGLAASAVFLASAALVGLLLHIVARRTRELGVRLALGASRPDIMRPVVRQALGIAAAGVIAGSLAARAGARVIDGVLHGVTPTDPVTHGSAAALMLLLAALAGTIPARRAARVNPIEALRMD